MKISLNNTAMTDRYLRGKLNLSERLNFERALENDPALRRGFVLQQKTMRLIRLFNRKNSKKRFQEKSVEFFQTVEGIRLRESLKSIFNNS